MSVNDAKDFGKVAVLMGGTAAERDISLISGKAVLQALCDQGIDAHAVDIGTDAVQQISGQGFDRVFNVLHGRGGEDGVIQGLLQAMGLPYTGSGVMGSAISMDKYRTKMIWQGLGLPTPGFVLIKDQQDLKVVEEMGLPVMIKPAHEGSSIGMSLVKNADDLLKAWQEAARYDSHIFAERWIKGNEYTVSILQKTALPVIKLETDNVFYDYQAKYMQNDTRYLIPCGLDVQLEQDVQQLALTAFEAVGAEGWGRVDLMMDEENNPWLIEVNTVPGMTSHSLVPMAAKAAGMDFEALVWNILEQTVKN